MMAGHFVLLALLALSFPFFTVATDPNQLQDFCVADKTSRVFVNGFVCKDPNHVSVDDFFSKGLDMPGDTNNKLGSKVTPVNVNQIPGLNTLGISLARIDFAPLGLNPPHIHPRATEVLTVLEGTLLVGFVTSNNPNNPQLNNKLFTKTLNKGDTFVFPQGLIHFQKNICGQNKAVAFAGLSSQNPGVVIVANAVFGAKPSIPDDLLEKAFRIDKWLVDILQANSWINN